MSLTINSSSLSLGNMSSSFQLSGVENTQKTEETTTTQSQTSQVTATSIQGDTLEISSEGQAASAAAGSTASETETEDTTAVADIVEESLEEDSDDSSTTDLSSCTDSELKEMYTNGEITLAEYKNEIAKRENE